MTDVSSEFLHPASAPPLKGKAEPFDPRFVITQDSAVRVITANLLQRNRAKKK